MRRADRVGPGRVLLGLYGLFVVAAGARSAVELARTGDGRPVAYVLSAVAAVVYAIGFLLVLRADRGRGMRAAAALAVAELVGVLVVGTITMIDADALGAASVWSRYGVDYLYVPIMLPMAVLAWLAPSRR